MKPRDPRGRKFAWRGGLHLVTHARYSRKFGRSWTGDEEDSLGRCTMASQGSRGCRTVRSLAVRARPRSSDGRPEAWASADFVCLQGVRFGSARVGVWLRSLSPRVACPQLNATGFGRAFALYVRGSYPVRTMPKKLTRTGNSLALVLDKPILEATGIDDDTLLEVSTDGDVIIVSPVRSKRRTQRLKKILDELHREHAGAFRRLAE
jgi:antitoxin MazE